MLPKNRTFEVVFKGPSIVGIKMSYVKINGVDICPDASNVKNLLLAKLKEKHRCDVELIGSRELEAAD